MALRQSSSSGSTTPGRSSSGVQSNRSLVSTAPRSSNREKKKCAAPRLVPIKTSIRLTAATASLPAAISARMDCAPVNPIEDSLPPIRPPGSSSSTAGSIVFSREGSRTHVSKRPAEAREPAANEDHHDARTRRRARTPPVCARLWWAASTSTSAASPSRLHKMDRTSVTSLVGES